MEKAGGSLSFLLLVAQGLLNTAGMGAWAVPHRLGRFPGAQQGPGGDPRGWGLQDQMQEPGPQLWLTPVTPGWTIGSGNRKRRLSRGKPIRGRQKATLPHAPM